TTRDRCWIAVGVTAEVNSNLLLRKGVLKEFGITIYHMRCCWSSVHRHPVAAKITGLCSFTVVARC
ncbi:hypothetical protein M8C21_018467, partial [Ambrosia artemisiifolia]